MGSLLGFSLGVIAVAALLSAWAHYAQENRALSVAIYGVFGIFSLFLILAGVGSFAVVDEPDRALVGWSLIAIGLALGLPLLRPVRRLLAAVTPLDPASMPDMVGLSILLGVVAAVTVLPYLESGGSAVAPVGISEFVVQAATFVVIAFMAVGTLMTRDLRSAFARLGLSGLNLRQLGAALGAVLVLFVISAVAGALTQYFQPELEREIGERMAGMLQPVTSVSDMLIVAISAGVGEEILFRGAVQPRYGIVLTSLAFAIVHTQYGVSFVTVAVFLIGIVFGIQRKRANTTSAIVTHTVWDFLALLAARAGS